MKIIGQGLDTSLWFDHWVGDCPLYLYPGISIPISIEHWRVAHIILNNVWNVTLVSSLFPRPIQSLILAIPLSSSPPIKDSFCWKFSRSGCFSIKSAYFNSLPSLPISSFPWKLLWKIHSPLKYKMLLWNLAHEILPVCSVLHSKIPSFPALCHRCLHENETHLHTFRDCPNSAMLWTEILSYGKVPLNFDLSQFRNLPWTEWLLYQFKFTGSWLTIFTTCIWHLWRSRNKAIFEGSMLKTNAMINLFWYDLRSTNLVFQDSSSYVPPPVTTLWVPPPLDYIKLNVNGAWKAIDSAGGGGVFRKVDSFWYVGCSAKYFASSPPCCRTYGTGR